MTAGSLCVRAWWGAHCLATHVLSAGLTGESVCLGPGADADVFFPSAGHARFRPAGAGFEVVVERGVQGHLARGGEAVSLGDCLARGWARASGDGAVLPLGQGDVVQLEAGLLRVEAFRIDRPQPVAASLGERLDERWLTSLVAVGSLAMLWLAFVSVTPTSPVGVGAREVPSHLVHLLVKAPRGPPPRALPRSSSAQRRGILDLAKSALSVDSVFCLCKPCWVRCGEPLLSVRKEVRCVRGACGDPQPLRDVLRANLGQVRYCLKTWGQYGQLNEALSFTIEVAATGEVGVVRMVAFARQSDELLDCLRARVRTWKFPAQPASDYAVSFLLGFRWDFRG